jgi:hypothetical protein
MGDRMATRKKKETYRDRWLREHPRVTFYLDRQTYDMIKELASKKNMSVKEFILSIIEDFRKYYDEIAEKEWDSGFQIGFDEAIRMFHDESWDFYEEFKKKYPKVEPALFIVPCSVCGKPMIFTHRDNNWLSDVRPWLLAAFRNWRHVKCPSSSR